MKTYVKTSIKGNESLRVSETVQEVFDGLIDKRGFVLLNRVEQSGNSSMMVLRKSTIKMVVKRK